MPQRAMADPVQRWVVIGFAGVAIVGFGAWRSLGPATGGAGTRGARPNPQLAALLPFATPLSDSQMTPMLGLRVTAGAPSDSVRRDPFVLGATPTVAVVHEHSPTARSTSAAAPDWRVSATLLAGDRRAAVIDDQLVYVGDHVPGGGTLTQVERDHVLVIDAKGATHVVAVQEGDQ